MRPPLEYPNIYPPQFPIVIQVARKFYDDHEGRGCGLTDQVIKRQVYTVTVRLDEEGWDDLISDARHYGYSGIDWDRDLESEYCDLEASAKRVFDRMKKIAELSQLRDRPDTNRPARLWCVNKERLSWHSWGPVNHWRCHSCNERSGVQACRDVIKLTSRHADLCIDSVLTVWYSYLIRTGKGP